MRVLVVTPYFYPHMGGSQRYIEGLYMQLMKMYPHVKVDVLTYNTEKVERRENYKGMRVYRLRCVEFLRGQFALPNYLELIRLMPELKKRQYDVVNTHTRFFDTSWWGWRLAARIGAKAILTDHCAYHPVHGNRVVRWVARQVDKVVIPMLGRKYMNVVAVSEATAEFLGMKGLGKPVKVFYGGVDVGFYSNKRVDGKIPGTEVKFDKKEVLVSYVGRLIPAKGADLVVKVAKRLVKKYPKIRFVVAGDGELYKKLVKEIGEKVHIVGNLEKSEVAKLLAMSQVLVHPSSHHEGFPMVLLEAGAARCAVVATNRGGVRELVEDGETGLLIGNGEVELERAVVKLVKDEKLRRELSGNLYNKVKREFDWSAIAKRYYEYLISVRNDEERMLRHKS